MITVSNETQTKRIVFLRVRHRTLHLLPRVEIIKFKNVAEDFHLYFEMTTSSTCQISLDWSRLSMLLPIAILPKIKLKLTVYGVPIGPS